ncbi:MAG: glycosyltransferase [Nibricoccus sp.]
MKLVVLAQTPPPVHGQSLMVQTLVEGLPAYGIDVYHVNLGLSHDAADIGRWRWGKLFTLLAACFRVYRIRRKLGRTIFYYVPAPAKRGALYRDWLAMILCRPVEGSLVLHWHAVGLGHWLDVHANVIERTITKLLLGRADLSLVLAESLATDPIDLNAKNRRSSFPTASLIPARHPPANRAIPRSPVTSSSSGSAPRKKDSSNSSMRSSTPKPGSRDASTTVAGSFPSRDEELRFNEAIRPLGTSVRYVGFSGEHAKNALLREADVFCFPTHYPHEGQPLVLMEALAHDLPIVTTRWRAIPSMLPSAHTWIVEPGRPQLLAAALLEARSSPRPAGASRRFFLENLHERNSPRLPRRRSSNSPARPNSRETGRVTGLRSKPALFLFLAPRLL